MTTSSVIELELINPNQLPAPDTTQFQHWLQLVSEQLQTAGEICIKVVDEQESQSLNHQYRGKDKPTNVLSFPADVPDFVASDHLGDLAICSQVVALEAAEQHKSVNDHWAHMTIHGVLHLLGYDHIVAADAETMEALEISLLAATGIPDPYQ